ncbi:uncharacterized protein LOC105689168 [Athalia rosae]|uniref:uncharacterized protein LOC105689168 n=1 Tax=Athalia rosae TaxID=37344 RepID=UPI002033EE94|nr:uncharacterized protein LOC105689168 [Athalia rosae]
MHVAHVARGILFESCTRPATGLFDWWGRPFNKYDAPAALQLTDYPAAQYASEIFKLPKDNYQKLLERCQDPATSAERADVEDPATAETAASAAMHLEINAAANPAQTASAKIANVRRS